MTHFRNLYIGITGTSFIKTKLLVPNQKAEHCVCFFRCNHFLIQRKHIPPCPPDVRDRDSIVSAAHHSRNGRTIHDPSEYLWLVAVGQGTASVVSHCYDTLDGGSRGDSWGRRVGCRSCARTREDQCAQSVWHLTHFIPSQLLVLPPEKINGNYSIGTTSSMTIHCMCPTRSKHTVDRWQFD